MMCKLMYTLFTQRQAQKKPQLRGLIGVIYG
jgi:hypothetical protein